MDKKTIFLELPAEIIDRIDKQNIIGDRSLFITDLLNKQLQQNISTMDISEEITSKIGEEKVEKSLPGEIKLTNNQGTTFGTFNINSMEGFQKLTKKISEISEDPIVRMKARRLR